VRRPEVSLPRRTDRGSTVEAGPTRRPPAGSWAGARTRIKLPADPYAEDAARRRPRLRGPLIAGGVILALFAIIALVNQNDHGKSGSAGSGSANADSTATPKPSAAASVTPTSVTEAYGSGLASSSAADVPVGYPHTSNGAEAAAANYVSGFNSAEMVYSWYRVELLNAIADPADAASLRSELNAEYAKIDSDYGLSGSGSAPAGDTFVNRLTPVGVTLASDNGSTAVVSVWTVLLQGMTGSTAQQPITEQWDTFSLTLAWSHGDWKWVSYGVSDGPAPLSGQQVPAVGSTLQAAASKYGGLTYGR
jgi:hypothetical protein